MPNLALHNGAFDGDAQEQRAPSSRTLGVASDCEGDSTMNADELRSAQTPLKDQDRRTPDKPLKPEHRKALALPAHRP